MIEFKKQNGFTLAEVLITLAIIGVVAALTIPTVVQNYQKQQTVVKLKKVYSEFAQAINLAIAENGQIENWDFGSCPSDDNLCITRYFFQNYLKLKYAKECYPSSDICWADTKDLNGNIYVRADRKSTGYCSVLVSSGYSVFSQLTVNGGQFIVDINGPKKGPNRLGRDVFMFRITTKGIMPVGFYMYGFHYSDENIRDYLKTGLNIACSKSASGNPGQFCGALIQFDGWQIKDDYPW